MSVRRKIPIAIRNQVAELAGHRCSYCRSPDWAGVPMVMDHIIPLSAGGGSDIENLCLCCYRCNEFKGARQECTDPITGAKVPLFKPRVQVWSNHFSWSMDGLRVIGLTACGSTTTEILHLNDTRLTQARKIWMLVGIHPPLE